METKQMSSVALKLYQGLTDCGEDKRKAKLFAEAFEEIEKRYPEVKDLATGAQLTEKSLLLQKEIKELDAKLSREIKELEVQIYKIESNLNKSINRQTWILLGGFSIMITILSIIQKILLTH